MSEITPEVVISRQLRWKILRVLTDLFDKGGTMGMTPAEIERIILRGDGGRVWTRTQVAAASRELLERGLIDIDAAGPHLTRATAAGRDFLRAGCPWEEVDRYSGRQQPGD